MLFQTIKIAQKKRKRKDLTDKKVEQEVNITKFFKIHYPVGVPTKAIEVLLIYQIRCFREGPCKCDPQKTSA